MFRSLPNLSSSQTSLFHLPPEQEWALPDHLKIKEEYRPWSIQKTTQHCFVSAFTGVVETQRVSESNQPATLAGLIADYDCAHQGDFVDQITKNADTLPLYVTTTFSGGARVWFQFEKPIRLHDDKVTKHFLDTCIKGLKLNAIFAGFDDGCFKNPAMYYEVGRDWTPIPNASPVPLTLLEGWLVKALDKSMKGASKGKVQIPFEKIKNALAEKYPGAWQGGWETFAIGSRGVRFWDGGDANSCIVREDGITCFTGDVGFVSWADLLGNHWVSKNMDEVIGKACENIFFESNSAKYWRRGTNVGWASMGREDARLHLRMMGITDEKAKGETVSPVERILSQVQTTKAVAGIFPFHYDPQDLVEVNGTPFLNTSRVKLTQPSIEHSGQWGEGFPNIAEYMEGFYDREHCPEQFACAMGELMHTYQTAYAGNLERGRVVFHAGAAGVGKTYNLNIRSWIFGGCEDASKYLLGQDSFNGTLVAAPIWVADDPVSADDHRSISTFSQLLKSIAACDSIPVRGMYRETVRLPWLGRVVVNINNDANSLRLLPNTELNLLDKVHLSYVQKPFSGRFPTKEVIKSEIPAFARFLMEGRNWLETFCPDLWSHETAVRWGVKMFHHPMLIQLAQASQISTNVEELLNLWRANWFGMHPEKDMWEGNPTELMDSISSIDSLLQVSRGTASSVSSLSRSLQSIVSRESPPGWVRSVNAVGRQYRIYKADDGATKDADPF